MSAQSSLKSRVLSGTIIVLICIVLGYFVTTPLWNKYKVAKSELTTAEMQNEQLRETLAQVQIFLGTFQNNQENVAIAGLALPSHIDYANFMSSFGDLANASGIALQDFNVNNIAVAAAVEAPKNNAIQSQRISFIASGSYPSFKDFILRLENHLRLIDIERITVASNETSGLLEFQVYIKTYYQR
jgi:Tfp pilus assembly protein PilO